MGYQESLIYSSDLDELINFIRNMGKSSFNADNYCISFGIMVLKQSVKLEKSTYQEGTKLLALSGERADQNDLYKKFINEKHISAIMYPAEYLNESFWENIIDNENQYAKFEKFEWSA
jgi:hypothetical protein